jgi:sporulation protein YlmC with PRC-barrel domain
MHGINNVSIVAAITAGIFLSWPAARAQSPEPRAEQAQEQASAKREGLREEQATQLARQQGLLRLERTFDRPVQTPDGEQLGTVADLAIDTQRGQVAFVMLSFGEWFGMGGRLAAVPFEAFSLSPQRDALISGVTKDQLEQARTFRRGEEPDITSRQWAKEVGEQFGYRPYWTRGVDAQPMEDEPDEAGDQARRVGITPSDPEGPAEAEGGDLPGAAPRQAEDEAPHGPPLAIMLGRELLDQAAIDGENQPLGKMSDLIVDMREGRIAFALLRAEGIEGMDRALVAVPYSALSFSPARQRFMLEADRQTLRTLAFAPDNWPDLTNEQWASRLHAQFNRQPYWQVFGYGAYLQAAGPRPMPPQAESVPQALQQAGVTTEQIDRLEAAGFPLPRVKAAVQQALLDQGLSQQEAHTQAQQISKQIQQLKGQGGEVRPGGPPTESQ